MELDKEKGGKRIGVVSSKGKETKKKQGTFTSAKYNISSYSKIPLPCNISLKF